VLGWVDPSYLSTVYMYPFHYSACDGAPPPPTRFERREALKARFEIEQRLIRQKKTMKKQSRQEKLKRLVRDKRSQKLDKSKSQAMDEYKAKRSAGEWVGLGAWWVQVFLALIFKSASDVGLDLERASGKSEYFQRCSLSQDTCLCTIFKSCCYCSLHMSCINESTLQTLSV